MSSKKGQIEAEPTCFRQASRIMWQEAPVRVVDDFVGTLDLFQRERFSPVGEASPAQGVKPHETGLEHA
jgi:hypothetical protein